MLLLSLFDSRKSKEMQKTPRRGFGFSVYSCAVAGDENDADWLLRGGGESEG